MLDDDKGRFLSLMNAASEYYQKSPLSTPALQIYFSSLREYEYEQVEFAIGKHIAEGENGQFYPKAADIVKILTGGQLSPDQVIALARQADTPLGILFRIQIGSFDLNNSTDVFYLKQRAEECLARLPEYKERAYKGEFSKNELEAMIKFEVDPAGPVCHGLSKPKESLRLATAIDSAKHNNEQLLLEQSKPEAEPDRENQAKIAQMIRELMRD